MPTPTNSVPMSLRLTRPQYDQLVKLREASGLSISDQLRRAVDHYIASWRDRTTALDAPTRKKKAPRR